MRRLIQPEVCKHAGIAALVTAVLCYPRFSLWGQRPQPLWYLEALTFCGGFVLWAFIFAWHTHYTKRPAFTLKINAMSWVVTTGAAVLMALALYFFLDPPLRQATPDDYPANLTQWVAMTLFTLAFNQLFLVFAPLAWLARLGARTTLAAALTVLFGGMLLLLKMGASPEPLPAALLTVMLAARLMRSLLSVTFYLQGGVWLASWFGLIVQARLLPGLLFGGTAH